MGWRDVLGAAPLAPEPQEQYPHNQQNAADNRGFADIAHIADRVSGRAEASAAFQLGLDPQAKGDDDGAREADFQERAAIVEHDAGAPRAWAEGFARLDPDRPPGDVPLNRWRRFVDDCGGFLDGGWAAQAAALGWGPLDLFGCDGARPFARLDRSGLLWLVDGRRLAALTAEAAVIEAPSGGRLTFRRHEGETGRVVPWELLP